MLLLGPHQGDGELGQAALGEEDEAAVEHVRKRGGRIVEGYAVEPASGRVPDVFIYQGPAALYRSVGEILGASRAPVIVLPGNHDGPAFFDVFRQYEPDHLLLEQARRLIERGVVVTNTADAVAPFVAEHCLMAALAGLRRLPAIDAIAGMNRCISE